LCARAYSKLDDSTFFSPRTRNCRKPRFRARAFTRDGHRTVPLTDGPSQIQIQYEPVISVAAPIMQDDRGSVVAVDRNVDQSVIVEITEGSAPCCHRRRENGTALWRDIREAALIVSQKQRRLEIP